MNDIYARTNNICLVFLTLFAGTIALVYMQPMLIPLIFSVFIFVVLAPISHFFEDRIKAPKAIAVILSLTLLFLALSSIVLITINSVESFVSDASKYQESFEKSIHFVQSQLEKFRIDINLEKITNAARPLFNYAQSFTSHIISFLGNLFMVFIFTIFMMAGDSRSEKKGKLVDEIMTKISSYISSKFTLSFSTGLLVWIVFLFFGIELASLFALLTILLNFIPTISSIVAVALPLPMVILQYQFGWQFFVVLGLIGAIQFLIGNVIEPLIMGDTMDLHPITVLMCLIFWGMVWGLAGMFLAVPITAVLKIIFTRIEATKDFAEILAGRIPDKI